MVFGMSFHKQSMQKGKSFWFSGYNNLIFVSSLLVFWSFKSEGQIVIDGANTQIVCAGSPKIVLSNLSYINNASSLHFLSDSSKVIFDGSDINQVNITSDFGYTTNFGVLEINRPNGVFLQSPLGISDTLILTNGLLDIAGFDLDMQSKSIQGGSAVSYIKTSSSGLLLRDVGVTNTLFPIGNAAYNPCELLNFGIPDVFASRVADNVTNDGTSIGATTNEAVVNRTWFIQEDILGGSDLSIRLFWNGSSEEINSFQNANAFMAQYISASSMWDNLGGTIGFNFIETVNNDSLSAYTVSSSTAFAPLNLEEIQLNETVLSAFPNPSNASFNILINELGTSGASVLCIRDANGRLIREINIDLIPGVNSFSIPDLGLLPGLYYLQFLNKHYQSPVIKHRFI